MINPLFPANVQVAVSSDNHAFVPDLIDDVNTEKSDVSDSITDDKSDVTSRGSSDGGFTNYVTSVRASQRREVDVRQQQQPQPQQKRHQSIQHVAMSHFPSSNKPTQQIPNRNLDWSVNSHNPPYYCPTESSHYPARDARNFRSHGIPSEPQPMAVPASGSISSQYDDDFLNDFQPHHLREMSQQTFRYHDQPPVIRRYPTINLDFHGNYNAESFF